ncbi:MAG: hypothetical protein ACI855_004725 [Myxococcota bacterium]
MSQKQRRAPQQTADSSRSESGKAAASSSSTIVSNESESGWFGQMVANEPTQQGVRDGVSRPDTGVKKGTPGAAIDESGAAIPLYSTFEAPTPDGTIKSGTAVKVVEKREGWIKVAYREDKASSSGWIDSGYFSNQPGLGMDEDLDSKVFDDYTWKKFEGDQTTDDLASNQVEQGALGDCFFIASMNAVGSANADFLEESIRYNAETETYSVRFFEGEYGTPKEVWIDVDAYLPTNKEGGTAYAASANGGSKWGPIVEKAYAKFKGGYQVLGEGGTGRVALAELTGNRSRSKNPSSMSEEEVIPYFEQAKEDGLAIYAGVINSTAMASVNPFSGKGKGEFKATLPKTHDWNEIQHGTVEIEHAEDSGKNAWENGKDGDKEASLSGSQVDKGTVVYAKNSVEVTYEQEVDDASKLKVDYEAHGVVLASKMLIGNHAYSFSDVVDGDKLQFYNPWGSYQPKAITAAEFLANFDSLATNQVPKGKHGDES